MGILSVKMFIKIDQYSQFNDPSNRYCNGSIRSLDENIYVRDFAEGFFAGLQICFTGPSDNEMYMVGRAYWSNGYIHWEDGEPMDYQPATGCNSLNLPTDGSMTPIIAVVDYVSQNACLYRIQDTTFYSLSSNCQYFLCKQDGH
ncbi:hypothetical protein WR25_13401 [Diploscapter pachys]|uniref:C-type lectin domain-containing protein n=1 Tax=Diploscapter pachys TaxID=2018661 RepID=A0A2A2KCA5_9BILA|nr:hypothetical protein WR25_13401 [Diploscapter pachys]